MTNPLTFLNKQKILSPFVRMCTIQTGFVLIRCPLLHDMYCADLTLQWETRLTGSHEGAYYPRSSKSIYCLIRRCNFLSSCRDTSKDDKRFKIVRVGASPTRMVIGKGKKKFNRRESAKEPLSLRSD